MSRQFPIPQPTLSRASWKLALDRSVIGRLFAARMPFGKASLQLAPHLTAIGRRFSVGITSGKPGLHLPPRRAVLAVVVALILVIAPTALAFTFNGFPTTTPQAGPTVITAGPDGNLWFTETAASKIGRITPAGAITEFPLPTLGSLPSGITAGPDRNLWFTEPGNAKVGRISTAGTITEFAIPSSKTDLFSDITAGPDGALWFIDPASNSLGQITTQGVVREFQIPVSAGNPFGITSGPDGGVWFTAPGVNRIERFDPVTGGFSGFTIPTPASNPGFITSGPDGALWFTEFNAGQIGRITTGGIINEFPVPTPKSGPNGITTGPDGAIWFTELQAGKIGQLVLASTSTLELSGEVAPAAIINEFTIAPTFNPGPKDIATGSDRNLWFTESSSAIGQLIPDVQQVTADLSISITGPSQIAAGNQLSYTIGVTNNSAQQTATGVTVSAPTPAGTTFSSVSGTGIKITPPAAGSTGTISAALGSMAPGATARFQVTVNVLAPPGTTLSISATVASTSTDPNPANNTATIGVPVKGGAIIFLSWHQTASTAANPTPPPDSLKVTAGTPSAGLQENIKLEAVEPAVTGPCTLTGFNIYKANSQPVQTIDANRWQANVPPDKAQATLAAAPGGSFYVMTSLWDCGGMIVESGASNTASECGGPEIDSVRVSGKIKIIGSGFTDPATGAVSSVFVDGFAYNRPPVFLDSTLLKQKGTINVNGTQMSVLDYMVGKTIIVITLQVQATSGSQQNTCISSFSFMP